MARTYQTDEKIQQEEDLISCKVQLRRKVEKATDRLEDLQDWFIRNSYEIADLDEESWQLFQQEINLCVERYLMENQQDLKKLTQSFQKKLEDFFIQVLLLNPSFHLEKEFPFERMKPKWNITRWNYEIILGIVMYARMTVETSQT